MVESARMMVKKMRWRFVLFILESLPFASLLFFATDASPAPLLEEVVNGVYPAARGFFTLFDVLLLLLIVMIYFRRKRPS